MNVKGIEQYCFYLMKYEAQGMHGETWTEATEDIYGSMAEYKLGLRDPYYRAIVALSSKKALKLDNLGWNNFPICFFNLEAFFIEHNDGPECNSNLINKVCNPIKASAIA